MESSTRGHVNVHVIFSDTTILQLTKCALATETGQQESAQKSCWDSTHHLKWLEAVMLPGALDWAGSRYSSFARTAGFSHSCPWKVVVFLFFNDNL